MKKTQYEITVAGVARTLTLFPIAQDLYIAGFVMFGDVEITVAAANALLAAAPPFDCLITAESKAIPLAYEMSRAGGRR